MSQISVNQVLSYDSWVHAVSGATGSVFAMSIFYPLDTVRARLQLEDETSTLKDKNTFQIILQIIHEDGFASLYRGLIPVLQSISISNFVYFYTFHGLKAFAGNDLAQQHALKDLMLGTIAGIVNVITTTPFWVVATRLKMKGVNGVLLRKKGSIKHYNTLLDGLIFIAKTEGIKGLWSGATASLALVCNPALQFMMYESMKRKLIKLSTAHNLPAATFFVIGALSKAFSTALTYPIQLIQTKLRLGGKPNDKDYPRKPGLFNVFAYILKTEGVKGLYRGIEAKVLQTVLTAALMFSLYEKIAKFVTKMLSKQTRVVI